jgi:hypothetical protein
MNHKNELAGFSDGHKQTKRKVEHRHGYKGKKALSKKVKK